MLFRSFTPSRYLVPDEYAKKQAIKEGILKKTIGIVGQPAFSDAEVNFKEKKQHNSLIKQILEKNKKIVLFISEPVANDQGSSIEENENYRGYTEIDVLEILVKSLKKSGNKFYVIVLPHPRQDVKRLEKVWQSLGGNLYGSVIPDIRGRDLLKHAIGVTGMASTLLYEAWLVGVPVLSIQPNLLHDSQRMMQGKSNVVFIDKYDGSVQKTEKWLKSLNKEVECIFQPDLYTHVNASSAILKELSL